MRIGTESEGVTSVMRGLCLKWGLRYFSPALQRDDDDMCERGNQREREGGEGEGEGEGGYELLRTISGTYTYLRRIQFVLSNHFY